MASDVEYGHILSVADILHMLICERKTNKEILFLFTGVSRTAQLLGSRVPSRFLTVSTCTVSNYFQSDVFAGQVAYSRSRCISVPTATMSGTHVAGEGHVQLDREWHCHRSRVDDCSRLRSCHCARPRCL